MENDNSAQVLWIGNFTEMETIVAEQAKYVGSQTNDGVVIAKHVHGTALALVYRPDTMVPIDAIVDLCQAYRRAS